MTRVVCLLRNEDNPTKINKMASNELFEAAAYLYSEDLVDEEEFMFLVKESEDKAPVFPYWKYPRFTLEEMNEDECISEFRFEKQDIPRLAKQWLQTEQLEGYANAVFRQSQALDNCWGFIDGTVRPICRPVENQKTVYNGHKRVHALKYQAVVAANGLIANLYGPVEGKRHDARLLRESGIIQLLENHSNRLDGTPLCIYGDPAYPLRPHLQAPFKNNHLTEEQQAYNKAMSKVRDSVEWVFGEILQYFAFVDFKKNQKIALSEIGKMYRACALLHNARTCLYGSSVSRFMDIEPPSLETYFQYDQQN
eukprot:gene8805-biopygen1709